MLTPATQTENQSTKPTPKNGSFFGPGGSAPFFQAKLTVNQPGDEHEREADAVAEQVMRMREDDAPIVQRMHFTPVGNVQRKCTACEEKEKEGIQRKEAGGGDASGKSAPSVVSDVLSSGGGQPIEGGTRQFMESRFGQDFSQVRIHTDSRAAESASAIQARAYTSGRDVVFGNGEYQPSSESGQRLLAHELVHVGQQNIEGQSVQREKDKKLGDVGDGTDVGGAALEILKKVAEEEIKRLAEVAKETRRKPAAKYRKAKKKQKKPTKARNALEAANKEAKAIKAEAKAVRKVAKAARGIGYGLDALGFGIEYYDKAFGNNSPAKTTPGKQVDALSSAGLNTAFGMSHPFIAAADALQEQVFNGKKPVPISDTISGSTSAITTVGEGIITGDTEGMSQFHERSKKGDYGWLMEAESEAGEWWAEEGGGTERATRTGDFYKDAGAPEWSANTAAFGSSVPILGHAGEFIGESAAKGYLVASDTISGSTSAISTVGDGIITGETEGMNQFHEKSKEGDYGWMMKEASEAGEWWAEEGGGTERATRTGDFYKEAGAPEWSANTAALGSSVPILGHVGEFLGESAAKGYLATEEAVEDIQELAEKNWTSNPDEIDWGRTLNPFAW